MLIESNLLGINRERLWGVTLETILSIVGKLKKAIAKKSNILGTKDFSKKKMNKETKDT